MYPYIHITSTISIPTYFLIISLTTLICSLWFIRRAEARKLARVTAIDLNLVTLAAGLIGARLTSIVFEEPIYYREHPAQIFAIWNGGFVFLGGVVGALFAATLFCQIKREPWWFWADTAVFPAALGYAMGRVGCFFNGCCYGKECTLPWAVFMDGAHRHPTQLYATFWELGSLGLLWVIQKRFKTSGVLFNTWLITHAIGRILMESFRDDPRGQFIAGFSLGTWMSAGLLLWAAWNIVHYKWIDPLVS